MVIRRGTTRTVVKIGAYAFKFPRLGPWPNFLQGLLANMVEAEFWTLRDPRLCPVLFGCWGGFFVVMPWVGTLPRNLTEVEYSMWLKASGWIVPVERKRDSFGVYQGRIVAIDYGN